MKKYNSIKCPKRGCTVGKRTEIPKRSPMVHIKARLKNLLEERNVPKSYRGLLQEIEEGIEATEGCLESARPTSDDLLLLDPWCLKLLRSPLCIGHRGSFAYTVRRPTAWPCRI
jgi:hypothetical protein